MTETRKRNGRYLKREIYASRFQESCVNIQKTWHLRFTRMMMHWQRYIILIITNVSLLYAVYIDDFLTVSSCSFGISNNLFNLISYD